MHIRLWFFSGERIVVEGIVIKHLGFFLIAFLKISMYGPELLTLQSYQSDEYICYNPSTGLIEVKVR